jgi:hypothetical protein
MAVNLTLEFQDHGGPDRNGHRYRFGLLREEQQPSDATAIRDDVLAWCVGNLGPMPRRERNARWWATPLSFWIRDENDAVVMRLRWC